jgi:hypothetical protein
VEYEGWDRDDAVVEPEEASRCPVGVSETAAARLSPGGRAMLAIKQANAAAVARVFRLAPISFSPQLSG